MPSCIDPAMRMHHENDDACRAEEEVPNEDEAESEDDSESEVDETDMVKFVKAHFFDRSKRPTELKCPFSNPSRANPCQRYAEPKSRKDVLGRHLGKVKNA